MLLPTDATFLCEGIAADDRTRRLGLHCGLLTAASMRQPLHLAGEWIGLKNCS
jgi:hypothetical protein